MARSVAVQVRVQRNMFLSFQEGEPHLTYLSHRNEFRVKVGGPRRSQKVQRHQDDKELFHADASEVNSLTPQTCQLCHKGCVAHKELLLTVLFGKPEANQTHKKGMVSRLASPLPGLVDPSYAAFGPAVGAKRASGDWLGSGVGVLKRGPYDVGSFENCGIFAVNASEHEIGNTLIARPF